MYGVKRGLYSNEAGMGSAPNAAATASVSHPAKQGLVQMLSVFIDTLLICTATAFMCLSTSVVPTEEIAGAVYVQNAIASTLGTAGPVFLAVDGTPAAFPRFNGKSAAGEHKRITKKDCCTGFILVQQSFSYSLISRNQFLP